MEGLFESATLNKPLGELAESWGVSAEQAAHRVRQVPFVVLSSTDVRGGGRGRPGRRLALDPKWRYWDRAGERPLNALLGYLRNLHRLGEVFALGVPFTSSYLQPFLHPEVRVLAPVETFSLWNRLFAGTSGRLRVVVDLLMPSMDTVDREGLPVLSEPFAVVDALQAFERLRNVNLLALADWLAHNVDLDIARTAAEMRGLARDLSYLEDHRRWKGARVLRRADVRRAHRLAEEMSRVPVSTRFEELARREVASGD